MKRYETIFITLPDLPDEDQQNVFKKIKDLIPQEGGTIVQFDEWGLKNLAYEIKKQTRGYYAYVDYTGNGALINELERVMRIDERVIKYMTVLTDEEFDPANVAKEAQSTSTETDSGDASKGEEAQAVIETKTEETNEKFDPANVATEVQSTSADNDSGDTSKEEQVQTVTETNREEGV